MRILLFGATGLAGTGVLRACLSEPAVTHVTAVARRPPRLSHRSLDLVIHDDFLDYSAIDQAFEGVEACFYCLGISVTLVSGEPEYRRITHDFALAAAKQLRIGSPAASFHFVSGSGAALDSRMMWARVKAETERDLIAAFQALCYRPGYIDGAPSASTPRLYRLLRPMFRMASPIRSLYVTADDIGHAVVHAAARNMRGRVVTNAEIRDLAERQRAGRCALH